MSRKAQIAEITSHCRLKHTTARQVPCSLLNIHQNAHGRHESMASSVSLHRVLRIDMVILCTFTTQHYLAGQEPLANFLKKERTPKTLKKSSYTIQSIVNDEPRISEDWVVVNQRIHQHQAELFLSEGLSRSKDSLQPHQNCDTLQSFCW